MIQIAWTSRLNCLFIYKIKVFSRKNTIYNNNQHSSITQNTKSVHFNASYYNVYGLH